MSIKHSWIGVAPPTKALIPAAANCGRACDRRSTSSCLLCHHRLSPAPVEPVLHPSPSVSPDPAPRSSCLPRFCFLMVSALQRRDRLCPRPPDGGRYLINWKLGGPWARRRCIRFARWTARRSPTRSRPSMFDCEMKDSRTRRPLSVPALPPAVGYAVTARIRVVAAARRPPLSRPHRLVELHRLRPRAEVRRRAGRR